MSRKSLLYLGVAIGSTIGSFVPDLWGAGLLSASGIFTGGIGGIVGLWAMYKLADRYGL